jgi:hypothetical protein
VAILKYNAKPNLAASADNLRYILRAGACAAFDTHNLIGIQTPADAIAYATARAFEEELAPRRGAGTPRNHHRMVLTFPDEANPEAALAVAKDFLANEFPEARAIISSHIDTRNLHCHVWLDARLINGKKLDLGTKYKQLDKLFARHYDYAYRTNHANEYAAQRQANRAERHKKQPDWKLLKANEQERTDGRKRFVEATSQGITAAARISEIAGLDALDRVLEPPSGGTTPAMGDGNGFNNHDKAEERSRTRPPTAMPVRYSIPVNQTPR